MKRTFAFKWYENTRYGSPFERTNLVLVSKATGDIGSDAKAATEIFSKTFGNLKKNTIVSIQELDEKGAAIGEPIIPSDEVVTVPVKKN